MNTGKNNFGTQLVENGWPFFPNGPTHPQPLQRGEQNGGHAKAVPLLGGVRGGFIAPMCDFEISEVTPEPSEMPRGFGVRWLAWNGADTALVCLRRTGAKAVCALSPHPLHSKTLARQPGRALAQEPKARSSVYCQAFAGALIVLGFVLSTKAQDTTNATGTDLSSFRLISERNIFNASRSGGRVSASREVRKPERVDTLALVGTMDYDKGTLAFFDGSSSDFRKALKAQATIAGYKITEITANSVKLESGEKKLELRVGTGLRREDEGEWKFTAAVTTLASSAGESSSGSSTSGRGDNRNGRSTSTGSPATASTDAAEILKRLMEKREKENQ